MDNSKLLIEATRRVCKKSSVEVTVIASAKKQSANQWIASSFLLAMTLRSDFSHSFFRGYTLYQSTSKN
jgi:hypothetical protein